jgi:iron-sulfur cluster repair protein YtfE (RIC family)
MNAIELLTQQHDTVSDLFEQIEQAEDMEEKTELLQDLADNLAAHATIEEKIFYPAAYGKDTKTTLEEAVEEHLSMKRVLADLIGMDATDENFDAKITVLKEQVEHHVEEEEGTLFPMVKREFDGKTLEMLGSQMEEMFETEMSKEPAEQIPRQTGRAAPLKAKGKGKGKAQRPQTSR